MSQPLPAREGRERGWPRDPDPHAVAALLRAALSDADTAWTLGSFGALAVFGRAADEPVRALPDHRLGLATARGAIALDPPPGLRPLAYETAIGESWNHAVALCLPGDACALGRRRVVAELGPDRLAARGDAAADALFDLGLGLGAVDACVRTRDPRTLAYLRAAAGRPLFAPGNPLPVQLAAMSPHRVFRARIGRIEVYAPIPGPGEPVPDGPHTHILPKLLQAGRTHAATTPIPPGLIPCAAIHPPHPCKDRTGRGTPFEAARHAAFQALLARWGDPDLLAVKHGGQSAGPSPRHARNARRVADLQARCLERAAAP